MPSASWGSANSRLNSLLPLAGGVSPKVMAAAGLRISSSPRARPKTAMRTEVCCSASTPRSMARSAPPPSESAANSMTWRRSGVRMPRDTSITGVGSPLG